MKGQTVHSAVESKSCSQCGCLFYRDKRNTWKHWEAARFCGRACSARWQAAQTEANRLPFAEDFARWFDKSDGCWLWKGGLSWDGYGVFNHAGRSYRAHRVALKLDGREPGPDALACHHCDTPACVNPAHLYPGSPSDNVQDMLRRGRHIKRRAAA